MTQTRARSGIKRSSKAPEVHAPAAGPGGWHAQAPARRARPPLREDLEVDVAIVGAGFSGLWTAYHLLEADPSLRVAVIERDVVGFGASGRNGGWLMAAAPADMSVWEKRFGLDAVRRAQAVLIDAVGEIAGITALEGIDCGLRLAGDLTLARSEPEMERLRARREGLMHVGWPEERLSWLTGDEVQERIGAQGTLGALVAEPCGTLNPVELVRGLAKAVEGRGARIFEGTEATTVEAGRVHCPSGTVRAPRIVMATEAFTVEQPGQARRYLPLASTLIQTAPLPAEVRADINWSQGEAVGDAHHLFFYAQLTPEGRIAIGGRGAPYRLGSAVQRDGKANTDVTARLHDTLVDLWPQAAGVPIDHAWSGSIAVPRDWCASCGIDDATGIAWIGGYGGHGVAASFVLARSVAAQVRGATDPVGSQPWTMHRPRKWEPEPLRWLASQAIVRTLAASDRIEAEGGTARRARLVHRFTGG
jgi:glycine/D-amino acid oxidase-like deaminating enzyme